MSRSQMVVHTITNTKQQSKKAQAQAQPQPNNNSNSNHNRVQSSHMVEAIEIEPEQQLQQQRRDSQTISRLRYEKFAVKHQPKSSNSKLADSEVDVELNSDVELGAQPNNNIDDVEAEEEEEVIEEDNKNLIIEDDNEEEEEEQTEVTIEEENKSQPEFNPHWSEAEVEVEQMQIQNSNQQTQKQKQNQISDSLLKNVNNEQQLIQLSQSDNNNSNSNNSNRNDVSSSSTTDDKHKIYSNKILDSQADSSDSDQYKPAAMIEAAKNNEQSCLESMISLFTSCFGERFPTIDIDGRLYKIEKEIAEGGFSFVYRAKPYSTNHKNDHPHFAVKKIIVQTGGQHKEAKWEIQIMKILQKQHARYLKKTIKSSDSNNNNNEEKNDNHNHNSNSNNNDDDDDSSDADNDLYFTEYHTREMELKYKGRQNYILPLIDSAIVRHEKIPSFKIAYMVFPYFRRGNLVSVLQEMYDNGHEWMDELRIYNIFIRVCFGILELHRHKPAYAHRDIKLDNVLLDENDVPYLMDFGSVSEAKVHVRSRNQALEVQDWAQQHMSAPYTPPEFFDCKSRYKFDVRTDVWALGCLLYAMGFGRSPFESEVGGSEALAVLSGVVSFPDAHPYSSHFCELINWMIKPKLKERPFVPTIIERVSDIITELQAEDQPQLQT